MCFDFQNKTNGYQCRNQPPKMSLLHSREKDKCVHICTMEGKKQVDVYQLHSDIKVFCVTASSFPDGIADAFNRLYSLLTSTKGREFFGISCPNQDGVIVYKSGCSRISSGRRTNLRVRNIHRIEGRILRYFGQSFWKRYIYPFQNF